MYATPFIISVSETFDRIAIKTTSNPGPGSKARLGIYNNSGGVPSALLLDAGEVDVASSGVKTITINQTLSPGIYWLVINTGVAVTVYGADSSSGGTTDVIGSDISGSAHTIAYYYHAETYGALPNPFGVVVIPAAGESAHPFVFLRKSA
jgi:hypothetical protein